MSSRESRSRFFDVPPSHRHDTFGGLFEGLVRIVCHQHGIRAFGGASDTPGKVQFRGETSGDGLLHRWNRLLQVGTSRGFCMSQIHSRVLVGSDWSGSISLRAPHAVARLDLVKVSLLYKGSANLPGYRVRLFHLIHKIHFFLIYYFENFQYFSDFEKKIGFIFRKKCAK